MVSLATLTSLTLLTALVPGTTAQACAAGGPAQEILGNWYCAQVDAITYTNFPGNGSYDKVTDMDAKTGQCTTEVYQYRGSLSPLDEELSLHVRGPIELKQMAVYVYDANSGPKKRDGYPSSSGHGARAGRKKGLVAGHHQHLHERLGEMKGVHQREHEHHKRSVGQMVSATMDGELVSWINMYAGPGAVATTLPSSSSVDVDGPLAMPLEVDTFASMSLSAAFPASSSSSSVGAATGHTVTSTNDETAHQKTRVPSSTSASMPASSSTGSSRGGRNGHWSRRAYYNAANSTAEGLTFLNHYGGTPGIPGTAAGGSAFGASLSYASSDAQSGAASPQVLSNAMLADGTEVVILSNQSCHDGDCGYTRPGGVAYHGFGGSRKIFLLEFTMPLTGQTSFNGDMPAIWLLNALIPLTSQYGTNPDCSCWTSGCGEFDLFEVLNSGNTRCKSTMHMAPAGGSSDWFLRPAESSMTAAVIFTGEAEQAAIRVLNGSQSFERVLAGELVDGWVKEHSSMFEMEV